MPASVRIKTGLPGLDEVLGGGLLPGRLYIVTGPPGMGKTVLTSQLCFARAKLGDKSVFVSMLAEGHGAFVSSLRAMSFFEERLVGDQISIVSAQQTLEKGGLTPLLKVLSTTLRRRRPQFLIIDSLSTPTEMAPSSLEFKTFLRDLTAIASILGCTTVCVFPEVEKERTDPQHLLADGLIHLRREEASLRSARLLEVVKHRGSATIDGRHVVEITSDGMVVRPRLEARPAVTVPRLRKRARVSTGIATLDEMLHGGLVSASSTAVLGSSGTGKTVLGLHVLAAAAQRGEPALYYGAYETPDRLIAKAEQVGVPLRRLVKTGGVELLWRAPLESNLDVFGDELLAAVHRRRVQHVFLDGLDGLRQASLYPDRVARYLTALTNELRARDVTTLISAETDFFGLNVRPPVEEVSAIFENLILLRYVELRSHLSRLLSILKVRDSDFDSTIREFRITSRGLALGKAFTSAEHLLSGQALPLSPNVVSEDEPVGRRPSRGARS